MMIEHKTQAAFIEAVEDSIMRKYEIHDGTYLKDLEFSSTSCECCGSGLAGARHHVVGYVDTIHSGVVTDFMICVDCYFYTLLGELPHHLPREEKPDA